MFVPKMSIVLHLIIWSFSNYLYSRKKRRKVTIKDQQKNDNQNNKVFHPLFQGQPDTTFWTQWHIPLQDGLGLVPNNHQLCVNARATFTKDATQLTADTRVDTATQATIRGHHHYHLVGLGLVLFHISPLKESCNNETSHCNSYICVLWLPAICRCMILCCVP